MHPFYILGIDKRSSDSEVDAQYQKLVKLNPPDRNPERFRIIRDAYEKVRNLRGRIKISLFYPGGGPQIFSQELPDWFNNSRPPLKTEEFRHFLELSRDE